MNEIMIIEGALQKMWQVSQTCHTETGGILVGTIHMPLILAAGEPGPRAIQAAASFSTDPEQDLKTLESARKRFGSAVQVLGYWHKHPQGMAHPSGGDLAQARILLADLERLGVQGGWFLCFIQQEASRPFLAAHPYYLAAQGESFQSLTLSVIPEQDPRVMKALQAEPLPVDTSLIGHPWNNLNFQFHQTPAGAPRLKLEKERLQQAGLQVQLRQRKSDQRLSVWIKGDNLEMLCVLPPEYPLGMPRFYQLPEGREVYPFRIQPVWNTDLYLADCVAALTETHIPDQVARVPEASNENMPFHTHLSCMLLAGATGLLLGWILRHRPPSQRARKGGKL